MRGTIEIRKTTKSGEKKKMALPLNRLEYPKGVCIDGYGARLESLILSAYPNVSAFSEALNRAHPNRLSNSTVKRWCLEDVMPNIEGIALIMEFLEADPGVIFGKVDKPETLEKLATKNPHKAVRVIYAEMDRLFALLKEATANS